MTTAKPCRHSRRALVKFEANKCRVDANGIIAAWGDTPDMDRWVIVEDRRCAKCGDVEMRFARKGYGETTERKALARYGIKPAALPAPPNHKAKAGPHVPLTQWPFPCSTWLHDFPRPRAAEATR